MSRLVCNRKGLGMVEVLIGVFITSVAILAVFSLVSPAWRAAARSDSMGRASGILYEHLVRQESRLMNPCCSVATGALPVATVFASGQAASQSGDAQFNVATTITSVATSVWRVTVRVSWTGHPGISESLVVTRQDGFVFPATCARGTLTCD